MAGGCLYQFEEDGIPNESPNPIRVDVERQTIAEEAKTDPAVFLPNRVIESIVQVAHGRKPADGISELLVLSSSSIGSVVNYSELPKAPMSRGTQFPFDFRIQKRQREQSPQVELVVYEKAERAKHTSLREATITRFVDIPILRSVDKVGDL